MSGRVDPRTRDRSLRFLRRATVGGAGAALGVSGIFSVVAAQTYSGTSTTTTSAVAVPSVPIAPAPIQVAPPTPIVITEVIHHPGQGTTRVSSGPRPPGQAPAPAAYPAPPAPVCHSTPSRPC